MALKGPESNKECIKKGEFIDFCRLCGSKELDLLFNAQDHQKKIQGSFQVVQCATCRLIFLNPMPHSQIIQNYYAIDDHYAYDHFNISFLRKLKDKLLYHCASISFQKGGSFIKKMGRFFCLPIKRKLIPMSPFGRRILDIGCGNGSFMLTLLKIGWEVYGCELSKSGVMIAKQHGLNVFHGTLLEAKYPDSFFDVIRLEQVLEHIYEPNALFKEMKRILRPNGLLIIGVPNSDSLSFRLFGKHWGLLGVPFHLFQYSSTSLKKMLCKYGFQIEAVKYISMPQCWLWSMNNFFIEKINREYRFLKIFFFKPLYQFSIFPIIRILLIFHKDWSEVIRIYSTHDDSFVRN